jgi:hypothetical protein
MPRPTSKPAFLVSDVHAEVLATFIWDSATELERTNGHGTQTGATVRMARRAARDILISAGVEKPDEVLREPERAPEATSTY